MVQFSLRNVFGATATIAIVLGFVSREPVEIGLAAAFCFASYLGIAWLASITAIHLWHTIETAIRIRSLGVLSRRYRWAYLDALVVLWTVIAIVVANFVLENSDSNARLLVLYGWLAIPVVALGKCLLGKTTDLKFERHFDDTNSSR